MAEQKNNNKILSDAVGTLFSKAKEFAASDAFTGAVERVKDVAANTGVLEVYEKGAQRAKSFGNATKTTIDLNRDHKELERVFAEIGKLYYEQAKDAPEGFFAPLFQQVETLHDAIAAKEAEVEAYKTSFGKAGETARTDDGLDNNIADFEAIVNQTETDGTST
jgi:hypothetical protein